MCFNDEQGLGVEHTITELPILSFIVLYVHVFAQVCLIM